MVQIRNSTTVSPTQLHQLADNIKIARNLRNVFPNPYTVEDAKNFLELVAAGEVGHVFAIYEEDVFIGLGSIVPQTDVYQQNAEIGYWLGEPFWNKGYATEAVGLLTDYAFNELGLIRVYASVFADNISSRRVLEKAGYALEGVLRSSVVKYGEIKDSYLYSKINT